MPKTPQERARAGMQRHRKVLAKQGRRQVAVHLTEPAIKALDDLGKAHGLDRSRVKNNGTVVFPAKSRQGSRAGSFAGTRRAITGPDYPAQAETRKKASSR